MKKLFLPFVLIILFWQKDYAQTSGPAMPETMSFEPVDATDMVNLLTGDFAYVLPILNIPGPEGGYPLALSYHGGIAMDQEATWVGLGWNINPGALNRSVNNFPDDGMDYAIKNVMPVAYRADHYIYRIIAKKYGCTSNCPSPAYSRYFFISGLSITWP